MVAYQGLAAPMRKAMDQMLQNSQIDSSHSTTSGAVQYFQTFCLDTEGVHGMSTQTNMATSLGLFNVPYYNAPLNVVPLPLALTYVKPSPSSSSSSSGPPRKLPDSKQAWLKAALSACFNCGDNTHNVAQCPHPTDRHITGENHGLLRECVFNAGGANKKQRRPRFERYFSGGTGPSLADPIDTDASLNPKNLNRVPSDVMLVETPEEWAQAKESKKEPQPTPQQQPSHSHTSHTPRRQPPPSSTPPNMQPRTPYNASTPSRSGYQTHTPLRSALGASPRTGQARTPQPQRGIGTHGHVYATPQQQQGTPLR